jgi:hypothetical protein
VTSRARRGTRRVTRVASFFVGERDRLAIGIERSGGRLSRARAIYISRITQDCDAMAIVREHWPAVRERARMHRGSLPGSVCD